MQQDSQPKDQSFSKGMKVTFGVIFALFLVFVVAPCAMCGGCGMFSAAMQGAEEASRNQSGASTPQDPTLEFTEIDTRVTEKNQVWWKYAWKVKVKNHSDRPESIDIKIKWTDADGFEVDSERKYNLRVPAGKETLFDGSSMITVPSAEQVEGIEVEEI